MDIEQLKLVLEALQSVGHEAGSLAWLWMWLKFAGGVTQTVLWGLVIVGVAYTIGYAIRVSEGDHRSSRFISSMRDMLGVGSHGYLTEAEREATQAAIRRLVEEHVAKTKGK